jgi:hypothetical protein
MPIATATATDAAAPAVFESASLGIGLAPTAGPPACAVASPTITASKPAAMSLLGLIDMMGGVADGIRTHRMLFLSIRGVAVVLTLTYLPI